MSGLEEIQTDFQHSVMEGSDGALEHVVGSVRGSARQRLEVYQQAYRLRLLEVLERNFPGLRSMLDEREFAAVGEAYIDAYPSDQASIRWFGVRLAEFLQVSRPAYPEWVEMARFDLARDAAFDAADAEVISVARMAGLSPDAWPRMRFACHPSVRTLNLQWNVCDIWQAIRHEAAPPAPRQLDAGIAVLVWRRDLTVYWRPLPDDEAAALATATAGDDFARLCTALCRWHDEADVPARGAGILKQWVTDGLIARIL